MKIPILALSLCLLACASSKETQTTDSLQSKIQLEEFSPIDSELATLQSDTERAKSDYDALQKLVLNRVDLKSTQTQGVQKLQIVINYNNVILINETAMSKNAAAAYLEKQLPALCNPNPSLKLDERADYEIASWILEKIYSLGCANVDLL